MYKFYGNNVEKDTFENIRLAKSLNHGLHILVNTS